MDASETRFSSNTFKDSSAQVTNFTNCCVAAYCSLGRKKPVVVKLETLGPRSDYVKELTKKKKKRERANNFFMKNNYNNSAQVILQPAVF